MNRVLITVAVLTLALIVGAIIMREPDGQAPGANPGDVDIDRGPDTPLIVGPGKPGDEARDLLPNQQPGSRARPKLSCPDPDYVETLDLETLAAALAYSDDPEHLLMASLYGGKARRPEPSLFPEEPNLDSLFKGLQIDPRNELLLWNAMTLCAQSNEQSRCDEHRIPELATAALEENAAFWLHLAGIRAAADDAEGAFEALENASTAPEYREYFIEHTEAFARGIAAFNNAPYNERIVSAIGLATALPTVESDLFLACQQQAPTSAKWLYACLAVGERMEAQARTLMTEMLGLGLQKSMYEIAGDDRRAWRVESRRDSRRRLLQDTAGRENELTVLIHDEQVLEAYIDTWKSRGEREAMLFLQYETRRLMKIPGYDPCERATNAADVISAVSAFPGTRSCRRSRRLRCLRQENLHRTNRDRYLRVL